MHDLVSSALHLGGALAALAAGPALVRRLSSGLGLRLGAALHVLAVVLLLATSGLFHLALAVLGPEAPVTALLVRLDHAAVWVLLAGFFVLPHLLALEGPWRWGPLGLVGGVALAGAAWKLVWFRPTAPWETVLPYALASVVGLLSTSKLVAVRGARATGWLLAFWAAFGLAAACFVLQPPDVLPGLVGHHELWHVGILAGVALHWRFVLGLAGPRVEPGGAGPRVLDEVLAATAAREHEEGPR